MALILRRFPVETPVPRALRRQLRKREKPVRLVNSYSLTNWAGLESAAREFLAY
jgi:hypothetical protein